jgi:uncharacterized protein (TIGR02147 family)
MDRNPQNQADFRLILQQEFVKRCQKNPRYSLRAFAKSLSIEPSPLSAILRGKRPLTDKMTNRLGLALGLGLDEVSKFVQAEKAADGPNYQQLALDSYALISDWYHYAILELIRVKSFKPDLSYIAKTLNISKTEAHIAVERLQRLELLVIKKNGKWIDTTANGSATNINQDLTSQASKKLQRQVLEKAIEALENLPTDVRSQTSMTMAIHPEDLDQAKVMIKNFRRELCAFLEKNKKPTQVYNLGISLYPLTNGSDQ